MLLDISLAHTTHSAIVTFYPALWRLNWEMNTDGAKEKKRRGGTADQTEQPNVMRGRVEKSNKYGWKEVKQRGVMKRKG